MGWEKSNVTNVYGNRENQLSPEQMDELLKWLCATGIYYPQQLPAEATATHFPRLLGPRQHTELSLRQLYPHSAWAEHVIYQPAHIIIITGIKHVIEMRLHKEKWVDFLKWTHGPKTCTHVAKVNLSFKSDGAMMLNTRVWSNITIFPILNNTKAFDLHRNFSLGVRDQTLNCYFKSQWRDASSPLTRSSVILRINN